MQVYNMRERDDNWEGGGGEGGARGFVVLEDDNRSFG